MILLGLLFFGDLFADCTMANHCQTTKQREKIFWNCFHPASKMQIQGECSDLLTISVFPVEGRLLFTKKKGQIEMFGGKRRGAL